MMPRPKDVGIQGTDILMHQAVKQAGGIPDAVCNAPPSPIGLAGWSILLILGAAVAVQSYAGFELLGLRWDGGPFLRDMLSAHSFVFYEQPRQTTQVMLELPVVIAMRLGIADLYTLCAIWSLTLQLAPLVLTCASYFILPARYRILFVLPVFHYFAGASNVASAGLIEGPTAAAYFWIVFFWLLFVPERWMARIAFTLAAIPTIFLHEVMAVLGPILAYAAWWRSGPVTESVSRLFLRAFVIFFLIVTVVQIGYVIVPTSVANRNGFVVQLLGLQWLYTTAKLINVPAVLGLLAGLTLLAMWRFAKYGWWLVCGFGIAAVVLLETALTHGLAEQFYARNHPAMLLLPLSMIALAALRWHKVADRFVSNHALPAIAILAILASGTLLIQVASVRQWAAYVATFRDTLQSRTGLIAWENLMKELPRNKAQLLERTNFPFTNPDMSLLLARDRHVQSIVMNPIATIWKGWNPAVPAQRPTGWFYDPLIFPADESGTQHHRSESGP